MSDDKSKKKIVVITGVTRGLGRAMAEKFIALGHTVLGCGRNREIISELKQRLPKRHDFDVVDVASDEEVQAWVGRLHKKCGAPDLVLNNAGVINQSAPLWKVSPQEFSDVIDVNIKGTANVIRPGRDGSERSITQERTQIETGLFAEVVPGDIRNNGMTFGAPGPCLRIGKQQDERGNSGDTGPEMHGPMIMTGESGVHMATKVHLPVAKLEDYKTMGIPEIWVIDPQDATYYRHEDSQLLRKDSFVHARFSFVMDRIKDLLD